MRPNSSHSGFIVCSWRFQRQGPAGWRANLRTLASILNLPPPRAESARDLSLRIERFRKNAPYVYGIAVHSPLDSSNPVQAKIHDLARETQAPKASNGREVAEAFDRQAFDLVLFDLVLMDTLHESGNGCILD